MGRSGRCLSSHVLATSRTVWAVRGHLGQALGKAGQCWEGHLQYTGLPVVLASNDLVLVGPGVVTAEGSVHLLQPL